MATHIIKPDSAARIALIADALGVPRDAPLADWAMESTAEGAMLSATVRRHVDLDTVNRILNA